jgi:hypothetical protein
VAAPSLLAAARSPSSFGTSSGALYAGRRQRERRAVRVHGLIYVIRAAVGDGRPAAACR